MKKVAVEISRNKIQANKKTIEYAVYSTKFYVKMNKIHIIISDMFIISYVLHLEKIIPKSL